MKLLRNIPSSTFLTWWFFALLALCNIARWYMEICRFHQTIHSKKQRYLNLINRDSIAKMKKGVKIIEISADHNKTLKVEGVIVNMFQSRARLPRQYWRRNCSMRACRSSSLSSQPRWRLRNHISRRDRWFIWIPDTSWLTSSTAFSTHWTSHVVWLKRRNAPDP